MSIELENPQTLAEILDAAWNHVGQIRIALLCENNDRVQKSLAEMDRLFSLAVEKVEESERDD